MLNEIADSCNVYLVTGYTDMRKGIDGLCSNFSGQISLDLNMSHQTEHLGRTN